MAQTLFVLLQHIFWPALVIIVSLYFLAMSFYPASLTIWRIICIGSAILGLALLGSLLWYIWEYTTGGRILCVTNSRLSTLKVAFSYQI
jgi:hypothetical protein